jgi:hypothetical protein
LSDKIHDISFGEPVWMMTNPMIKLQMMMTVYPPEALIVRHVPIKVASIDAMLSRRLTNPGE